MFRRRVSGQANNARILIANSLVDIDPDYAVSASDLPNRGTGGSGYDLDTNVGTAANRKIHPSGSCLLFGASGDYASTPDSATVTIAGDIDVRVDVALDDWTPALTTALLAKVNDTNTREWFVEVVASSGLIRMFSSTDGSSGNQVSGVSTAAPTISDGERLRIRVTLDVDDGSSNRVYNFYTSTNFSSPLDEDDSWTQLGATVTTAGTTSIYNGNSAVEVGSIFGGTLQRLSGVVYSACALDGIDGTLAVDFDPTNYVSGTTFSSGGVTWTLNGNSFIQNTGHDVLHSIGSNGLETASGQSITGPVTVFLVARSADGADSAIIDSRSSASARCLLGVLTSTWRIFQGDTNVTFGAVDTDAHVWTGQFNGDTTTKLTVSGEGSVTGDAGPDNWDFGTIMADANGNNGLNGYLARLLVFNYALSETQVSAIQSYLSAYYSL